MRMFGQYLWKILSTWWGAVFLIAGAISTGVTFAVLYRPSFALPHWIPAAISILAWLIAPYRLYTKQQTQIDTLAASQQKPRRAKLAIIEEQGSYYIRRGSPQGVTPKREEGLYLELWISIENKGDRAATITSYGLRIDGLGEFVSVRPSPQTWIWGMRSQHSLGSTSAVSSYIEVPAERLASHQRIPLMLDSVLPPDIGPIRCELTVRDTEGNSASAWLTAVDRG